MAGLLLLWLLIEAVPPSLKATYVSLFSDNFPTLVWVNQLSARGSHVAMQFLRALSSHVNANGTSLLTPLHIPGEEKQMTDIPSWLFGRNTDWLC